MNEIQNLGRAGQYFKIYYLKDFYITNCKKKPLAFALAKAPAFFFISLKSSNPLVIHFF